MSFLRALGIRPYSSVKNQQANLLSDHLLKKLEKGDYLASELMLAKSSDENRERMIYGVASSENAVSLSAMWVSKHPSSAHANTLLGASLIVSGWKIRGGGYAEDVDDSDWAPFLSKLKSAEEPLRRAIELDGSIADPYSWLIHASIGQDASKEDIYQLFVEATSRVPLHFPSHYKYFNAVTEKWGGSHKEMFSFVRDRTKDAPHGHTLHCLVPAAYNEFALSITSERGVDAAFKALRNAQYANEVAASLYAWLSATPENLSKKLGDLGGSFASYGLNNFGVALYICGAKKEAKEVLCTLNGEIESTPWVWIAKGTKSRMNPAFVYDQACKELGVALPK